MIERTEITGGGLIDIAGTLVWGGADTGASLGAVAATATADRPAGPARPGAVRPFGRRSAISPVASPRRTASVSQTQCRTATRQWLQFNA